MTVNMDLTLDIKHVFKDILNFCAVNATAGKENIGQTHGNCLENDTDQHFAILKGFRTLLKRNDIKW